MAAGARPARRRWHQTASGGVACGIKLKAAGTGKIGMQMK